MNGPLAVTIMLFNFGHIYYFGDIWKRVECDKLELRKPVKDSMSDSGLAKYTVLIYIVQDEV